jgi:hypothetical protein
MARTKGSKNRQTDQLPTTLLTIEERLSFIANLIVDKIIEDQESESQLFNKIVGAKDERA